MARVTRRTRAGLLLAVSLAIAGSVVPGSVGPTRVADAAATLPAWHGGVDLYRSGTFTTQRNWLWCTAADVQIIRNIVRHQTDHSTTGQRRYFTWMRAHNRYRLPLSAGVDAAGWTAGLRNFVDDRYRLVASRTFAAALKSAVTNLRQTNLPVGITVSNGNHAWVLTGFTATADPLVTTAFTVTSVRVVGPLYGLQSRNGYDMRPDTKLTPTQLRHFFTPWRYAPMRMIWDGRYVSIQPIPKTPIATAPASPTPSLAAASLTSVAPSDGPAASASSDASVVSATTAQASGGPGLGPTMAILVVGLAVAVMAIGVARSVGRSRAGLRPARRPRPGDRSHPHPRPHARPQARPQPHR